MALFSVYLTDLATSVFVQFSSLVLFSLTNSAGVICHQTYAENIHAWNRYFVNMI